MASVFRKDDNYVEKPNRNAFPKTYESNLTTKFGQIVPAFCKPVMIGETVKIDPEMNLNFLPMVFPVQNRVRASLSFYYVRNRNLWKDWMDFQFKMKDGLVPPHHVFREETYRDMLRVGGLLDHLGVPVVLHGSYVVRLSRPIANYPVSAKMQYDPYTGAFEQSRYYMGLTDGNGESIKNELGETYTFTPWYEAVEDTPKESEAHTVSIFRKPIIVEQNSVPVYVDGASPTDLHLIVGVNSTTQGVVSQRKGSTATTGSSRRTTGVTESRGDSSRFSTIGRQSVVDTSDVTVTSTVESTITDYYLVTILTDDWVGNGENVIQFPPSMNVKEIVGFVSSAGDSFSPVEVRINVEKQFGDFGVPLSELSLRSLPFPHIYDGNLVDGDEYLHISSMPARAIMAIYNAFVRNETNNPLMIDGKPEYNKYIVNDTGGPDSDYYPLYKRNWQDDCFTTALHSPQHGVAPLVGLRVQPQSGNGDAPYVVVFDNVDGTKTELGLHTDGDGFVNAVTTPYANDEYANTLANALMDGFTNFGLAINDFRNVNSFQRWLENNVRKGYKYPDQIKAHAGVSVKYNILDMPEYIGGMSRDMNVNTVVQTVENDFGNLGDFSGHAYIKGNMEHSIEHFCDEEGFIIGLLSVDPVAPYSQVLPKYLLRESAFDYYSHEFGKIGMQPILKREIAPLQSFYEGNGLEVFGYQRAWYDMLDGLSEVHGKFRTDFRNFIINRTFNTVPELGEDFLTMSDDDMNNVFYVDDGEDKILGQILFRYDSIQPIPMYGIPALE